MIQNFPFSEIISAFIFGGGVWFWQNVKTRREKKKSDVSNFNTNFSDMIDAQNKLMEQNQKLVEQVMNKNREIVELQNRVVELEKKIKCLEIKIEKFTNQNK